MFKPSTPKIEALAKKQPQIIQQLEGLLAGKTRVYIDWANVYHWAERLNWRIDVERLYRFLKCFDNIDVISIYSGTLEGNQVSEESIRKVTKIGYRVRTKPVKIMKVSIDATSINSQSTDLIKKLIHSCFFRELDINTIENLNKRLKELNAQGKLYLEEKKCNFDVEIGVDMILDKERKLADCFCLWSGDSDFHDPVRDLIKEGKRVILFATARRISTELGKLNKEGLVIFDIAKVRNFICWNKDIKP